MDFVVLILNPIALLQRQLFVVGVFVSSHEPFKLYTVLQVYQFVQALFKKLCCVFVEHYHLALI